MKTESVDARTLAHLLRADLLPEAYAAPPELRDLREPLRHRWVLERLRASLKCRVPCADRPPGILPPYGELFGKAGGRFLSELDLRDAHRGRPDSLLSLIADLDREVEVAPARSGSGPKETSASGC